MGIATRIIITFGSDSKYPELAAIASRYFKALPQPEWQTGDLVAAKHFLSTVAEQKITVHESNYVGVPLTFATAYKNLDTLAFIDLLTPFFEEILSVDHDDTPFEIEHILVFSEAEGASMEVYELALNGADRIYNPDKGYDQLTYRKHNVDFCFNH